jgi:hypothetical protein
MIISENVGILCSMVVCKISKSFAFLYRYRRSKQEWQEPSEPKINK